MHSFSPDVTVQVISDGGNPLETLPASNLLTKNCETVSKIYRLQLVGF